jgi:hypothetical protein
MLRGRDHDPPVAAAQVIDDVVRVDAGEPEHGRDDRLVGRDVRHVAAREVTVKAKLSRIGRRVSGRRRR